MSIEKNTTANQTVRKPLTKLQFEMLQFCATDDAKQRKGIPPTFHRHLKPAADRALNSLINRGYVEYDAFNYAVATDAGRERYNAELEAQDE